VASLLKAKYYPSLSILQADLGAGPSYTWQSIWGAKRVILEGMRWLIGNGESVNVWTDRWLPSHLANLKVCDLIDFEEGVWRESFI